MSTGRGIATVLAATGGLALALMAPATAGAVSCAQTLTDSNGTAWLASLTSGAAGIPGASVGTLLLNTASYTTANPCTFEDGDRELGYPPETLSVGGVTVERKIFVPAGGTAFARFLTILSNSTTATLAPTVEFFTSAASNRIRGSSSGDLLVTPDDAWGVRAFGPPPAPPPPGPILLGEIWDAAPPLAPPLRVSQLTSVPISGPPYVDTNPTLVARYGSVAVPPGGSAVLMHVVLGRSSDGVGLTSALADAASLAAGPPEVYAGMSATELSALRNWPHPDPDGDGVRLLADKCPAAADPGQADLDADGKGDACDDDIDGDAVPNALETSLGMNPSSKDSDGDGSADGADACPTTSGALANGCPVPAPAAAAAIDTAILGPSLTGVASKLKLAAFLKGVTGRAGCAEACSVAVRLLGSLGGKARLSRAYNVLLGSASLRRGAGRRSFRVKPSKALVGKARKLSVKLEVVVTDAGGNQATRTKTIAVG